ncbi:MAG: arylsulfotransferase family protein [Actinomycetota bacterium]|nr:arylsulfotransferase family protein [Actinomycetota bacterium]
MRRRTLLWFLAAVLACTAALALGCGGKGGKPEPSPKRVFRQFHSRPDLKPPAVEIDTPAKSNAAPGYIFFGPKKKVKQRGPLIVDNEGNVIWFKQVEPREATDFRAQRYQGKPVLTWWEGKSDFGIGQGFGVIYDDSYRKIATVHAGNGLDSDLHEFRLTPRNTALLTIYHKVPADLSKLGGPKQGFAQDGIIQEVDVATGKVLFEWHSLPEVPFNESYTPLRKVKKGGKSFYAPYDYFHPNSVFLDPDGNYLVSARNTRAVYLIGHKTGKILWRLGGKKSDFKMGTGTHFAWQHDAQFHPDGTLTLFDNESMPPVGPESRALTFKVDHDAKTVTLLRSYSHPDKILAPHQGNFQVLPNGNGFVGWGGIAHMTEFSKGGKVVFDAHFSSSIDSYRAYRDEWHGHPADKPRIAVRGGKAGKVTVYASWNGATDVSQWRVLAGDNRKSLKTVREADKLGFETEITAKTKGRWIAVEALDSKGDTLGTSKPKSLGHS